MYRLATAGFSATAPIVHVGSTGQFALTLTNPDPSDGFSENLLASVLGVSGSLTGGSGSVDLAAGASDNSSLVATVSTQSAGFVAGVVDVSLTSDGAGIDTLGATSLGTAEVAVNATVNNYAQASLLDANGVGTLSYDAATDSYTLDLGTVEEDSDPLSSSIAIENAAFGPADLLSGDLELESGGGFTDSGFGTVSGLGAGQSAIAELIALPTSTSGTFSETFLLDASGSNASGYEGSLQAQTLTVTGTVQYRPDPDLVVSSVTAPTQAVAGQLVPITWTLTNEGAAPAVGPWSDDVYVASDAEGDNLQLVGTFAYDGAIGVGDSVTRTEQITVPTNLSGNVWFVVQTDPTNELPEHRAAGADQTIASAATSVAPEPLPELVVASITPPTTAFSGQQTQVSWTVTNEGDAGTSASSWHDNVYISLSSSPATINDDITDPLLASVANPSYLAPGRATPAAPRSRSLRGSAGPTTSSSRPTRAMRSSRVSVGPPTSRPRPSSPCN